MNIIFLLFTPIAIEFKLGLSKTILFWMHWHICWFTAIELGCCKSVGDALLVYTVAGLDLLIARSCSCLLPTNPHMLQARILLHFILCHFLEVSFCTWVFRDPRQRWIFLLVEKVPVKERTFQLKTSVFIQIQDTSGYSIYFCKYIISFCSVEFLDQLCRAWSSWEIEGAERKKILLLRYESPCSKYTFVK